MLFSEPSAFNRTSISAAASVCGLLTTFYLYRHTYRGDIALLSLVAVYAAQCAVFELSGKQLFEAVVLSSISMTSYIGTMVFVTVAYRLSPFHPLWSFPGPLLSKITSLKLVHIVWSGKRWLIIKDLHDKYGKFVRTGPNTLSINSYDAIMPIYTTAQSMDKSDAYRPGRSPDGGLFFIRSREEHNLRRRVWAAAFSNTSVEHMMNVVEKRTRQMLKCMNKRRGPDGLLDMTEVVRHWSFDLMAEITFGQANRIEMMEDGDPDNLVANVQMGTVGFEIFGEAPSLFDVVWNLPLTKDMHALENRAAKLMDERKTQSQGTDICSHLLGEHGGDRLNEVDLNLDSAFSIVAGSDTTAGTITLLLYYLLSNRTVYSKLRAELDAHFGSPDDISDFKALQNLPYLFGVVHEGLRLGTPFPGLPRVVQKGGRILDGVFVPEDTIVGVPPYVQQTHPENFYPSPLEFLPERWQPEGLGPQTITRKSAIMCFSFGAFSCLGKGFAIQELHLAVAKLVLAFDMQLAPSFDHQKFKDKTYNMRTTLFEEPLMITAIPRD